MAYTDAQIRDSTRQTYEHVNATVYGGRLPAWGDFWFRVTDSPRRLGCVKVLTPRGFGSKVIGLEISRRNTTLAMLADTVRHEIAHIACVTIDQQLGHGYTWMKHANLCGATPKRCSTHGIEPRPGDYVIECGNENCDKTWVRTRMSRLVRLALAAELDATCPQCKQRSKFTGYREG